MADALFLSLTFLVAAAVASGTEYRHAWNFADMTQDCKPWVSLRVKLWNSTELQNITVTLSTSTLINRRVLIRTSESSFPAKHRAPCLYHGTNANAGKSVFASEIEGRLKMTFKLNGSWYQAEKPSGSAVDAPAIAEKFEAREDEAANLCHYKVPPSNSSEMNARGASVSQSRGAFVLEKGALNVESFQGATVDKILELVIVVDRSFVSKAGSESSAVTRVLQIANFVNGLYQSLRLRVVLTEIIVWSTDEILVNSDSEETLNRFTRYKAMQLSIRHDTVMLLSAQDWVGGTLGVAWLRATCKKLISCGIVLDKYPEEISTALVLTHEIGHNLGFQHMQDHFGCVCNRSSTGCIMNSFLAASTRTEALGWSSCSTDSWSSQASETWRSCLSDAPDVSYSISSSASVCGNGILEAGEQCDCGPEQTCSSKCCDARTCRLKAGAICASGACCDWNTCRLKARGNVCRAANGPCDVPETCSGSSEWCPENDKVADGVDCAAGQAYCYKGKCRSSDAQCQRLFSSSARSGDSQCFTRLNVKSDYLYGHCQMLLSNLVVTDSTSPTYSYLPCLLENAECGLQQCYQDTRPFSGSRVKFGSTTCYSLPNIDLSSSGLRSPSFVPDGARCGTTSMCVNSTCTPLSTVRACKFCPDCSGNGVLTTGKVCFCKADFDPPNCSAAGCGGSVTSPLACSPPLDIATTAATPTTGVSTRSTSTPESSVNSETPSTPILRRFTETTGGVNSASRLPTTRWISYVTTWSLVCIVSCYCA